MGSPLPTTLLPTPPLSSTLLPTWVPTTLWPTPSLLPTLLPLSTLDTASSDTALLDTVLSDTASLETALLDTVLWDTAVLPTLEAFAVNNAWARFFVFLFGDPHGLESGQRSKDGATDPYRVFTLRWSNDLNLQG